LIGLVSLKPLLSQEIELTRGPQTSRSVLTEADQSYLR
jgi:hypothetical protein